MNQKNGSAETKVKHMKVKKNSNKVKPVYAVAFLGLSTVAATPLANDIYLFVKLPVLALSLTGFMIYGYSKINPQELMQNKRILILIFSFLGSLTISGLIASTTLTRLLWGESGRNNGLITWTLLSILLLITLGIFNQTSGDKFFEALILFLVLSNLYFLLQYLGLNVFNENYVYGPMVGFFGNPNFTSAFLGMSFAVTLGACLFYSKLRVLTGLVSVLSLVEIYLTNSLQGFMMAGSALAFYLYIFGLRRSVSQGIMTLYLATVASSFGVGLLGLLGLGPLGDFREQSSFRIRLGYFESAISMWATNPLEGVGTDSYGDFFRQVRPDWVIPLMGDSTTSNDAHNIFLNLLATSGFFAFLFYFSLNAYCLYRGFAALRKGTHDIVMVIALAVVIGFQLQSLISINHIGLAIWGWLAMGVVFVRSETITRPTKVSPAALKNRAFQSLHVFLILSVSVIAILGFLRLGEALKLKSAVANIVIDGSQQYKEQKFAELASVSGYWIPDVSNSMLIQEAFLNISASEAAETISKATYAQNLDSRDALWALVAIQTRRGNFTEAIALREKLIVKEKQSSWVLLDQADSFAEVKNRVKAIEFLNKAKAKADVDPARIALIQAKIDLIS
jgi:O-antigen ligase